MIVVDIEASGVDYEKNSIVSIGALEYENPSNRIYIECRIWEGSRINKDSLAICGFSEEEIKDKNKRTEGEAVKDFLKWSETCNERTLVGQNVSFDRDFLRAAAEREHLNWPLAYRTIDTHSLAVMHIIKRGKNVPATNHRSALDLDAVLNYTGIPSEPEPHNALTGALSHAEVTSRLLHDKKMLPEFDTFPIPWIEKGTKNPK